ncbi:MAG TPA: hypothetical protein VNA26_08645 [Chitinophagaceae bacterium]|nr:hypothetical protein [Chitinophagaceae bacterium]
MEEKDFLNQMENLKKPDVHATASQRQIKLALLNTKKSAWWGLWILVVPVFFFCCVAIKYLFGWNWGVSDNFVGWMAKLDQQKGTGWITPVLFVVLPGIGALVNLLAIMHFTYDKMLNQLMVTIKLKWLNIMLFLISMAVVAFVILYGIMENAHHRAIEQYDIGTVKPETAE